MFFQRVFREVWLTCILFVESTGEASQIVFNANEFRNNLATLLNKYIRVSSIGNKLTLLLCISNGANKHHLWGNWENSPLKCFLKAIWQEVEMQKLSTWGNIVEHEFHLSISGLGNLVYVKHSKSRSHSFYSKNYSRDI